MTNDVEFARNTAPGRTTLPPLCSFLAVPPPCRPFSSSGPPCDTFSWSNLRLKTHEQLQPSSRPSAPRRSLCSTVKPRTARHSLEPTSLSSGRAGTSSKTDQGASNCPSHPHRELAGTHPDSDHLRHSFRVPLASFQLKQHVGVYGSQFRQP